MARSDLLLKLAEAVDKEDKTLAKKTFDSIIAEERAKNHHIVADRLIEKLHNKKPNSSGKQTVLENEISPLLKRVTPEKSLNDLILDNQTRVICEEVIEEQNSTNLLRSYGLEPRNRLLFVGPPGNGKTSLAEALASHLMLPFYVVNYDSLIGSYLGETSSRLKKIFNFIDDRACVIFFDEFETIAKERGAENETGEIKRVVSSLLLHIDDLPSNVVVITASNHDELLDRAVWRRFQVKLNLPNPTRNQIEKWFKKFFNGIEYDSKYSEKTLAKYLYGKSFSDIEQFGLDVKRRYVLRQSKESFRETISYKLKQWKLPNN